MHKTMKRFGLEGVLRDKDIPRLREQFEASTLKEMREEGYAPVLGFGPHWSTVYDDGKDQYHFILSIHGIYVGRRKACEIEGISVDGATVPLTAPNK